MKSIICGLVLLLAAAPTWACGKWRWDIKTGTDPQALHINVNSAIHVALTDLTSLPIQNTFPQTARITPTEMQVYNINATITSVSRDQHGDYHLLAQDADGNKVITDIPDPQCIGSASPFLPYVRTARNYVDHHWKGHASVHIPASITGVAFFGVPHMAGVAPNDIQLHPVLKIRFLNQ